MPKRLIDSSFLDSPSMEVLSPAAQDAFPRFILLCDDFGCFEVNPDRLRANGWSKRPDVTVALVSAWLYEYTTKRALGEPPVAMMWTDRGRRYCYLTGWFGSRGQRKRAEYDPRTEAGKKGSKRHTPAPPAELVAAVMAGEVRASDGLPLGSDLLPPGNEDFPPGIAAGSETEKVNDSVPAREIRVPAANPAASRGVPAYAVADATAVAVPPALRRPERPARVGVGSPAFDAVQHWRLTAWPKRSPSPCPVVTERQVAALVHLVAEHTVPVVTGAMDRATADPFWADKLDLDTFIARFARFLPTHPGAMGGRGPQPVGRDFTKTLGEV